MTWVKAEIYLHTALGVEHTSVTLAVLFAMKEMVV